MSSLRWRVPLGVVVFVLWMLLSASIDLQEVFVGAIVALILASLRLPGAQVFAEISLVPKRVLAAIAYLGVFLWAVVKSNIDVAFRVLSPELPIRPGIVRVTTRLESRIGRLLLANSITLTPGTISVEIDGEDLFIHWINVGAGDVEESTRKIVAGFEKYLEVCCG